MLVFSRKTVSMVLILFMAASLLVIGDVAKAAESRLTILNLGDSYSSGTGGGDYYGKSSCYRSKNSYGQQFANKVASTGVKVEYINVACHGAMTWDIPKQINEIGPLTKSRVDLVLVTIGGNNGGFERVVKNCFAPGIKSGDKCKSSVDESFDLINSIKLSTKHNIKHVLDTFPTARVVLIGYPYLVDWPSNKCSLSLTLSSGVKYYSGEMVRSLTELSMAAQSQLVRDLQATYGNRILYTNMLYTFNGHENCGDKELWMKGNFDSWIVGEWWHPNKKGYKAISEHLYRMQMFNKYVDIFKYSKLPFSCGFTVRYASTYNTTMVNGKTYNHGHALDMPVPTGTRIVSPVNGILYNKYDAGGYGHYVQIHGYDGRLHRLAHMSSTGIVANGLVVRQGQLVGYSGSSGASTGPHLHYEQWRKGVQVPLNLGGPSLEWGVNLTAGGYRITLHTLESANCR